ncbi:MAG: hypothetical protein ABRQ27_08010 [Clostridiaceae bacterium]
MNKILSTVYNLINIELKTEDILKRLKYSMLFLTFVSFLMIKSSITNAYKLMLPINIWDGIFTIITQPFFILLIYLPVFLIATSILLSRDNFSKYLIIRCSDKKIWILSRVLCQLIINLLFTFVLFLLIALLSGINLKFGTDWSQVIKDSQSISIINTKLYPNNFVHVMTPYSALMYCFWGIFLAVSITTLLRDLFMELVPNLILANTLTILYLAINYVLLIFPQINLFGKIFACFSLYNVALIWWHRFDTLAAGPFSLNTGLLCGLTFVVFIISFRLLLSKRMVFDYD